jgi:hypothetical protein
MATFKDKKKTGASTGFYFARKSQNEIYYQMASLFKAANVHDGRAAEKIFTKALKDRAPEILVENFL